MAANLSSRLIRPSAQNESAKHEMPTGDSTGSRYARVLLLPGQTQSQESDGSERLPAAIPPLSQLPIFSPGRRTAQQRFMDESGGLCFAGTWGRGRRLGPPLTIVEEDVLLALLTLRKHLVSHQPNVTVATALVHVSQQTPHAFYCSLSDLGDVIGSHSRGGYSNQLRIASLERLASTRLEFHINETASSAAVDCEFKLIENLWIEKRAGTTATYVHFHPGALHALESSYAEISLISRMSLAPLGKALQRFLSTQPQEYAIEVEVLKAAMLCHESIGSFHRRLYSVLQQLKATGWLMQYALTGNGRTRPFRLSTLRAPGKQSP